MAKLIYSAIVSLDGYVADQSGNFDWAAPDEEVHAFVNDLERPTGTYLYGRRRGHAADLTVGGPGLAGQAIRAGLVDDYHLFLTPVVVGGGTPALPDGVRRELELLDERRFGGGVVDLRYRTET